MRIVVAVDEEPYSDRAVEEASRLACNTWPDVRLLAVAPKSGAGEGEVPQPWWSRLQEQRRRFLAGFEPGSCPYPAEEDYRLEQGGKGLWEEAAARRSTPKDLRIRLRRGAPAREILAECDDMGADLLVLGCGPGQECSWSAAAELPPKVAAEAPCSVLVVKGEPRIEQMVCCLDQQRVSQASLELINQLVTLYQARLELVGITEKNTLKAEVERRMAGVMEYYAAREIRPWLELVERDALPAFIDRQAQRGLVALWMGKESILQKIFSRAKVRQLVGVSKSPVLILR